MRTIRDANNPNVLIHCKTNDEIKRIIDLATRAGILSMEYLPQYYQFCANAEGTVCMRLKTESKLPKVYVIPKENCQDVLNSMASQFEIIASHNIGDIIPYRADTNSEQEETVTEFMRSERERLVNYVQTSTPMVHFEQGKRLINYTTPLGNQVGGDHYKKLKIQPFEYCMKNNMNAGQTLAIRYITRYKDKGGLEDLQKAIHTIELLIEEEYANQTEEAQS